MERNVVAPTKPVWKFGRDKHESLQQHKETVNCGDQCHGNNEVRYHVREKLRQRFRAVERQEHVEKVPVWFSKTGGVANDDSRHKRKQSRSRKARYSLGCNVKSRMIITVPHFLFNYRSLDNRER
mmetsp:Transcript_18055/g.20822  ORF Transcript_18055/g.20822 Transcript_18055/m.20822 type:complete len:125 (+) Transcript_18055:542-916(+)